ncbi:TIR domain-containing protein [Actinosynnema sp. NPDC020468]|uniref:TIR domain-containing protein n=1 Tax=Actinosynnema sp. NPDC020468 TaxID=3154488 RepID=UPI0033DB0F3A
MIGVGKLAESVPRTVVSVDLAVPAGGAEELLPGVAALVAGALTAAGVDPGSFDVQESAGGCTALVRPEVAESDVAEAVLAGLTEALAARIAEDAAWHGARLRAAVHSGKVSALPGRFGGPLLRAVESLVYSSAMEEAQHGAGLAVITTGSFYDRVLRGTARANEFRPVRVHTEVLGTTARIWTRSAASRSPAGVERTDFAVVRVDADAAWAQWIAFQLEGAGFSTEIDAHALEPGRAAGAGLTAAADRAERVILVVSPALNRRVGSALPASRQVSGVRVTPADGAAEVLPEVLDLSGMGATDARAALLREYGGERRQPAFPGSGVPEPVVEPAAVEEAPRQVGAVVVHAVEDADFADDLEDSLLTLETEGLLSWVDVRPVHARAVAEGEVDGLVRDADVVLLVVSRDLQSTRYGSGEEMRLVLRRDSGKLVVPVVYRATPWERQPFGHLSALPTGARPVVDWRSRDEAMVSVVDGVRLAVRQHLGRDRPEPAARPVEPAPRIRALDEVFPLAGVPTVTFVEPDWFTELRMALRQPGLAVVVEGPAGIGKSTVLHNAVERDRELLGEAVVLRASSHADLARIRRLPREHSGLVVVDDFQRLPGEVQDELADYLKLLADTGSRTDRLVLAGLTGTATRLVGDGVDLAARVRVFRVGQVSEELVRQLVDKGEQALNIAFADKAGIVRAAGGSLLTTQMLCWQLVVDARITETAPTRTDVPADLGVTLPRVAAQLATRYEGAVAAFGALDPPTESRCLELLLELGNSPTGDLRLTAPFPHALPDVVSRHLFHDRRGGRLVVDDPQFLFYLRQSSREDLVGLTGRQPAVPRDQVFLCHSPQDVEWLQRLEVHLRPLERKAQLNIWSDQRIPLGTSRKEAVNDALNRAKVALVLVSAYSLGSDLIVEEQLPRLLEAAGRGGCLIVPVLVGPSQFLSSELAIYDWRPRGDRTLSEMSPPEQERQLADLVTLLTHTIERG